MQPSLKVICSAGWSPVGRPVINGVTCPVSGFTVAMRELLFCAPTARMAWFESVAKSRPPLEPFSNAMSIAGPCAWRPPLWRPPLPVGLERTTDQASALVEDQDVGREGVGGRELAPDDRTLLVVAPTRQAVPRLQHEHLKPACVAAKRDGSREV